MSNNKESSSWISRYQTIIESRQSGRASKEEWELSIVKPNIYFIEESAKNKTIEVSIATKFKENLIKQN